MNKHSNCCKSFFYGLENDFINSKVNKFEVLNPSNHFAPNHNVEPEHIKVEIEFDFTNEVVYGTTTIDITVKSPSIDFIILDAKNLTIQEVNINSLKALFENDGKKLTIFTQKGVHRGEKLNIRIKHFVEKPVAGVYFVKPSMEYPNKHLHVWTQCQERMQC